MKNMIRPPPSPIHAEGESLSEWFCPLSTTTTASECSSLSIPFADLAISYMDDASDTSSHHNNDIYENDGLSQTAPNSIRGN